MRVGIDAFTIRELCLDAYETFDYLKKNGFDGVLFGHIHNLSATLDNGRLRDIRDYADGMGLYSEVGIDCCNPYLFSLSPEDQLASISNEIRIAADNGWHELYSSLGGVDERYTHPIAWTKHLKESAEFIKRLKPVLKENGCRIDLETHGDTTTFELVRMIEDVGPDILGICLDTANVLCHAEDPVMAARRAAPYTHMTHAKDGMIFFSENGYTRQGRTPGQGMLDWEKILSALGHFSPELTLSIEDHKWLFEMQIFDEQWIALHPDLTPYELAQVMKMAIKTENKLKNGEFPDVSDYESIPYIEQMEERLNYGRNHLKGLLKKLNLDFKGNVK
ncbi:MAG: sugar phosphate isomerase/epimerase family protein [Saccharofermentanales bacterium]